MHPRSLILTLAIVAGCSSSASRSNDTRAADEAAIEAAMKGYSAAILSNDAAKVAAWWTEDGSYINRSMPTIHGRAGIDSLVRSGAGAVTVTALSVEKDDLAVSGDLAYFLGRYREVIQPRAGAAVDNSGRVVLIWKRQADGAWKIGGLMGTDLAKSPAAEPVAEKDSAKARG